MSPAAARDDGRPRRDRLLRILLPSVVLALSVAIWEAVVRINAIPPYLLPGPGLVLSTLVSDWGVLSASLIVTHDVSALLDSQLGPVDGFLKVDLFNRR